MRRNSYVPNKMWAGALGIWRVMSKKKKNKKRLVGTVTGELHMQIVACLMQLVILYCNNRNMLFLCSQRTNVFCEKIYIDSDCSRFVGGTKKKNWSTHLPMPVWLSEGVLYILITTVRTRRTLTCMRHSTGDRIPLTRRSHRKWFCVHNNKIIKIE